jgi:hypothetical protein
MSTRACDIVLRVEYAQSRRAVLARAWNDRAELLLALVKRDLANVGVKIGMLNPQASNVSWPSDDAPVAELWWTGIPTDSVRTSYNHHAEVGTLTIPFILSL